MNESRTDSCNTAANITVLMNDPSSCYVHHCMIDYLYFKRSSVVRIELGDYLLVIFTRICDIIRYVLLRAPVP